MPLGVHMMVLRYWHIHRKLQNNVVLDLAESLLLDSFFYCKKIPITYMQATLLMLKLNKCKIIIIIFIIFCRNYPSQYLNSCEHLPVEVQMESCTQVKIVALDFNLFMVLLIHSFLSQSVSQSVMHAYIRAFIQYFHSFIHAFLLSFPPLSIFYLICFLFAIYSHL